MKYTFVISGRLKENYLREAVDDYCRRLRPFASTEVIFLEETAFKKEPSASTVKAALDEEAKKVLTKIGAGDKVIIIDLHGQNLDSLQLAEFIDKIKSHGSSHIFIIVGSSYGLSDLLRQKADLALKLSSLTFPHPVALLLALEQIYRVEMILAHQTYHK